MGRDAGFDHLDERRLVEVARHDAGAFAALYRRYVDRIHTYAYRRTYSTSVADDVTAATFEKALRGLDRYRWSPPGIGPWLFRIASHELVDHHRKAGRDRRIHERLAAVADAPAETAAFDDVLGFDPELRAALDAIRPRYQRALGLRFLADLSNEEAAAAMGVSRATMAVIVHRALAAVRRRIDVTPDEGCEDE